MADPVRSKSGAGPGGYIPPQAKYITTGEGATGKVVTVPTGTALSIADQSTGNTGTGAPDPWVNSPGVMPALTGVLVQADPSNSAAIEVGYGLFTLGDGISLSAGDSRKFPVADAGMIYCLAAVGSQKLRFLVE